MKLVRKLLLPTLLVVVVIVVVMAIRQGWFNNWNPATIRGFMERFGPWAIVVYILLMALNTVTIMPPTIIMMVMAGILFGPVRGSIALWTGLLLGSILAFLIARFLAQDFVSGRMKGRAAEFNEKLKERGFSVVFIARLVGLPPYEFVNYASGLSKISFRDFVFASMLGSIPSVILISATGDRLLKLDFTDPLLYAFPSFVIVTFLATRLYSRLKKQQN